MNEELMDEFEKFIDNETFNLVLTPKSEVIRKFAESNNLPVIEMKVSNKYEFCSEFCRNNWCPFAKEEIK